MIGVVVWSKAETEKAVIWCEDQAALAYLQGRASLTDPSCWPEPGDLLELEAEMIGNLRHARQVTLLTEGGRSELPQLLKKATTDSRPELRLVSSRKPWPQEDEAANQEISAIRAIAGR